MKISLLLISMFLISCASMKPNYRFCKDTDWRELGMRDAKNDKAMEETFQNYKMMCKSFDESEMKPNLTMYRFGHDKGVKALCTYTKGKEFGLAKKTTSVNCNRKKHKKFYKGINDGVNEYCRFESGYNRALEGNVTSKVCSVNKHKDFYRGVRKGIKTYCTYQYGVKMGSEDKSYTGACKGAAETEFIKGHTVGKTQSEVKKLKKQISDLRVTNARLEERVSSLQKEVNDLNSENYSLKVRVKKLQTQPAKKPIRVY